MRVFFVSLLISILFFKCDTKKILNHSGIELLPVYKGSYNTISGEQSLKDDSVYNFLYDVNLVNNSDKQLDFIVSSCSIVSFIVSDPIYINHWVNNCASNSLRHIELKHNQKFSFPIIIQADKKFAYTNFKMGFILMDEKIELEDFYNELFKRRKKLESVIWSSEIKLDPDGGVAYEIEDFAKHD